MTTAYLNEGIFTLSEIRTPTGYVALDEPIMITVTTKAPSSYDLTVTSGTTTYYISLSRPGDFYTTTPATNKAMARITVRNRKVQKLTVVKEGVDGNTRTRLSGVHIALYEQVKDSEGNVRPAYTPEEGYEEKDIYFRISDGAVTLTDEEGEPETYSSVVLRDDNTTIVVKNAFGIPLPNTGGTGTNLIYLIGFMLIAIAGAGLMLRRSCIL